MNNKFEIKSGKMIITDPCYEKGTWCTKIVPARNGVWEYDAWSGECGGNGRVHKLTAQHIDPPSTKELRSLKLNELGVDSGQLGFFDHDQYPSTKAEQGSYDDTSSFYGKCCLLTSGENIHGSLGFGCVSSSGYGDGMYDGFAMLDDDGNIISIEITFIEEEEEDDLD